MQTKIELPKAFSVRDEHEFHAFQHLMARLESETHGQTGGDGSACGWRLYGLLGFSVPGRPATQQEGSGSRLKGSGIRLCTQRLDPGSLCVRQIIRVLKVGRSEYPLRLGA